MPSDTHDGAADALGVREFRHESAVWRLRVDAGGLCHISCNGVLTMAGLRLAYSRADGIGYSAIAVMADMRNCAVAIGQEGVARPVWDHLPADSSVRQRSIPWAIICTPEQALTMMPLALQSAKRGVWYRVFTDAESAREWALHTAGRLQAPT